MATFSTSYLDVRDYADYSIVFLIDSREQKIYFAQKASMLIRKILPRTHRLKDSRDLSRMEMMVFGQPVALIQTPQAPPLQNVVLPTI